MMMGIGLALATLGAILRYAVENDSDSFDLETVGLILMIVGGVAFATGVGLEVLRSRRSVPAPYPPAPAPYAPTPPAASVHPAPPAPPAPGAPPQPTPPPPSHPH